MGLKHYEGQKAIFEQMGLDYDAQMEMARKAAEMMCETDASCMKALADLYRPVATKFSSEEKFVECLQKAAEMGDPQSMAEYGIFLMIGKVYFQQDQAKGMEYLLKAKELGDSDAINFLEEWNNDPEVYEYDFNNDYYYRRSEPLKSIEFSPTRELKAIPKVES